MKEWQERGWPLERGAVSLPPLMASTAGRRRLLGQQRRIRPGSMVLDAIDAIANRSVGQVLAAWLLMVLGSGMAFWITVITKAGQLIELGVPIDGSWSGLKTSLYFSFVTATSVGYGDVVPTGLVRPMAMAEAVLGLLIFGFVISKFLGRRQEELVEEIHRIAFEDRLDRVQMNLHFVLSELQAVSTLCDEGAVASPGGLARVESVVRVFAGELRTIHDLLYRPQHAPDEEVLEAILANLAAAFEELYSLATGPCARGRRGPGLERTLTLISALAAEICGDCVPRQYALGLKTLMDRVQALSRKL